MADIRDLPSAWRGDLMPASFRGARFHVEVNGLESGRRIVVHEFPKKDLPYAEDMGRRAVEFTVRGYCIVHPRDADALRRRDYRVARDRLDKALREEGRGALMLPTLRPMMVVCQRYRLTEDQKTGGYCVFDMSFVEYGVPASLDPKSAATSLQEQASALGQETQRAYEHGLTKNAPIQAPTDI